MNMNLHATGASFIAQEKEDNPRDIVVNLLKQYPSLDRTSLFSKFREELKGYDDYQRKVDWYFFVNMHDYLTGSRKGATLSDRISNREEAQRRAATIKQKVVEVILLDLMLPNGKSLRDCTFADCAKAGGFFAKIANKGKPRQVVGDVLSEEQLRACVRR